MRISRLAFANIVIALVLLSTPFLIQLTASAPYDPWADLDDDGDIDIFDVVKIAAAYSTAGDPAKNVAVTNWPLMVTPDTTVWYGDSSFPLTSATYNGSGFSSLHILLRMLWAGPGSSCEVQVRGIIWDHSHVDSRWTVAYTVVMDEASDRDYLSVTIPVPSETFYFHVNLLSGDANIFLSFYLSQT
jgi:hypothetical protein